MTDVFDFTPYPTDETDLEMHANDQLADLVIRLSDAPLTLPGPCGPICEGPKCHRLLWQFRQFKCRVMSGRQRFGKEWLPERSGVVCWMPEAVLQPFMTPENSLPNDLLDSYL